MPSFHCSAILFDLDGVLVDSTRVVAAQYTRWALENGLDPGEVMKAAHGVRTVEVIQRVAPHLDSVAETKKIEDREAAAAGIVPIPGAVALLNSIPQGRWCVVTSGTRFLATTRMRKFGIPVPDVLVTADDVRNGKPDPEPYRKGAELLKVDPATCVVVEDAPAGIRSAHAAGMKVISLPTTYPVAELHEADVIVSGVHSIKVSLDGAGPQGMLVVTWG
ncbi:MAG: HAD family hydrolase [Terriglobales bacterium]